MSIPNSILSDLLTALPFLRPQMYFKSSLTALSHAMEDQVLAGSEPTLVIASFQRERFYRQEAHRYRRIGDISNQVYVLAAPETEFKNSSDIYESVAFETTDTLSQEWHLVVINQKYSSCLICRERTTPSLETAELTADNIRRFEGIWTFEREVAQKAAQILLQKILTYRPELALKIAAAHQQYLKPQTEENVFNNFNKESERNSPDPFVQRLVSYLQASQYKLLKANRNLAEKEKKERLLNSITAAIRRSLDPEEILQVAVQKLGEGLGVCRCLVYRCKDNDTNAIINHEFLNSGIASLKGQTWPLKYNPLFQDVVELRESISIDNAYDDPRLKLAADPENPQNSLHNLVSQCSILSWLLVPVLYHDKLLGMMELHHCGPLPAAWKAEDIALVDAIATQLGVALMQAEAYANLEDLNQQLEALDRTRSNLVAITGHELRTPLSTIQVCLESLASEPDMSQELQQIMLNTALKDAERMRKLIQDFLTLSQLESGRVQWHPEALSIKECIELALSHIRARNSEGTFPQIHDNTDYELPLVQVDGEWLVEVLSKLLDNACKFTNKEGKISIEVNRQGANTLEVTVSDTGRGIEPSRLESVFDRFYQEEGALQRSAGGTGLGLAICRQIVNGWGGEIWAKSAGKNHGSQFHFTIPVFNDLLNSNQRKTLSTEKKHKPSARKQKTKRN